MSEQIFRDFIPEGNNLGAVGNGFKDFVPTPDHVEEVKPIVEKTLRELKDEAESLGINIKKLKTKDALKEAIAKEISAPEVIEEPQVPVVTEEPVVSVETPMVEEPKTE